MTRETQGDTNEADASGEPYGGAGCEALTTNDKRSLGQRVAQAVVTAPILAYRYTFSGLVGGHCRHLPTCSDYAREAVAVNGAWRGGWLTLARLWRCSPWGTHGFDPMPDIRSENHPFAPWRYGRWRLCSDPSPGDGEKVERRA